MKYILIILALFYSLSNSAQQSDANTIGYEILQVLENSKAIHQLTQNYQLVKGQMADLEQWNLKGQVTYDEYQQLQRAYTAYSGKMNYILDQLFADMRSFNSIRKLKGARLDRFVKKFNTLYNEEFQTANATYTNDFSPPLQRIAARSDSKAGILGSILLILEFGETIYTGLRSLFTTGKLNRESEGQLLNLGINFAIKHLDKKLRYPTWQEMVSPPASTTVSMATPITMGRASEMHQPASLASRTSTNHAPVFRAIDGAVSLSTYGKDEPILLTPLSKQIVVGSDQNTSATSALFGTHRSMSNGDRFWVKLQGYEFANFFYYDELTQSWLDPFGKSIVVGSEAGSSSEATLYLPSNNQFFEIEGPSKREQFLILVSNASIPASVRTSILNQQEEGVLFLEKLQKQFPEITPPSEVLHQAQASQNSANSQILATISIDSTHDRQVYIPIYIVIEKDENH